MSCTQNLHFVHISQLLNVPAFHKVTRSHDLCGAGDYNLCNFSASGDLLTALLLVFAETSPPPHAVPLLCVSMLIAIVTCGTRNVEPPRNVYNY